MEVLDGDTEVEISGLASPVYEGQQLSFTVTGSNIPTISSYEIEVNAYAGENSAQSTTNSDLGFNATSCSDVEESDDVTSGASSHTVTFTLHVCDSEYNGGIVTVTLVDDDGNVIAGDWIYLEARPITVTIEADNPFPATGDTEADGGPDTVTLTAVTDAPTGTTFEYYHWQTPALTDENCTNASTATSRTHSLDSTTTTTKSVRVIVKENTTATDCYISEALYITWDLEDTLSDITEALVAVMTPVQDSTDSTTSSTTSTTAPAVATPTPFPDVERALLKCVKKPSPAGAGETYDSFAHLMNYYTGDIKTLLDSGGCSTEATTAWNNLIAGFQRALAGLKEDGNGNLTPVGELLATPRGITFETNMTSALSLRSAISTIVVPGAIRLIDEPQNYSRGYRDTGGTTTRDGDGDHFVDMVGYCLRLHQQYDTHASANTQQRLDVLNCIYNRTPWFHWLTLADEANADARETYTRELARVDWLGDSDFICSILEPLRDFFGQDNPLAQRAACLKHDLAWNSLPAIISETTPLIQTFPEMDAAWNPRNKFLSDFSLYIDFECRELPASQRSDCLTDPEHLTNVLGSSIFFGGTSVLFAAVAKLNTLGWPVPIEDIYDAHSTTEFVKCRAPLPIVSSVHIDKGFINLRFSWDLVPGCSTVEVEKVTLCDVSIVQDCLKPGRSYSDVLNIFALFRKTVSVEIGTARLSIANREYGPEIEYVHTLDLTVEST